MGNFNNLRPVPTIDNSEPYHNGTSQPRPGRRRTLLNFRRISSTTKLNDVSETNESPQLNDYEKLVIIIINAMLWVS